MTPVDIAILAVVTLSMVFGFLRGLVRELVGLAGVVAAFLLAGLFGPSLGAWAGSWIPPMAARLAGYTAVFFVVLLASALLGRLLTAVVDAAMLSFPNRVLGGLFGLARGALLVVALCVGLQLFAPRAEGWVAGSRLGSLAWSLARPLAGWIPGRTVPAESPDPAPPGGRSI